MANAICEISKSSTTIPHNNSTNSNKTSETVYLTELFALYKSGIYHSENGDCLPSCIAYKSYYFHHPNKSPELLNFTRESTYGPFLMHPETGTKDARKYDDKHSPCTYPKKIILQKKKQNNFFRKAIDSFLETYTNNTPFLILKDYASRKNLSPAKIEKIIKKLEKSKKQSEQYIRTEKGYNRTGIRISYNCDLIRSHKYKISHCEKQIRMLKLKKENPVRPPIISQTSLKSQKPIEKLETQV